MEQTMENNYESKERRENRYTCMDGWNTSHLLQKHPELIDNPSVNVGIMDGWEIRNLLSVWPELVNHPRLVLGRMGLMDIDYLLDVQPQLAAIFKKQEVNNGADNRHQ